MKIANTAPLHLSNLEVLEHFLDLKSDTHILQQRIETRKARNAQSLRDQFPLYKDVHDYPERQHFDPISPEEEEAERIAERRGMSNELIWVQDQVIKYLCSDLLPTSRQTSEGVQKLADGLQDHGLVKGEVLQICNLAPTQIVELYCIIEDTDQRFIPEPHEKLETIAQEVEATLLQEIPDHLLQYTSYTPRDGPEEGDQVVDEEEEMMQQEMLQQEYVYETEWGAGKEQGVGEEVEGDMD